MYKYVYIIRPVHSLRPFPKWNRIIITSWWPNQTYSSDVAPWVKWGTALLKLCEGSKNSSRETAGDIANALA